MSIISRQLYKTIEWHFFNVEESRAKVTQFADDTLAQAYQSIRNYREAGHGTGSHGDPTARLGVQLAVGTDSIVQLRKWIWVVETVTARYSTGPYADKAYGELIRLYYRVHQGKHLQAICTQLHIDRRTFYRMKEDIVYAAALAAAQRGAVEVF